MLKKLLTVFLTVLFVPLYAFAQGALTGTVTDRQSGDALPGATIYIVELERGASTNIDGEYTIEAIPAGTYTVRFSYVGYSRFQTTTQIGNNVVTLNAQLAMDVFGLEEVVVTGVLGDTQAKLTPFSVGRISSRELEVVPSITPQSALRGKIAGVNIVQGSGQPGSAPSIVLRGITSISESNAPLYIVDGVILGSSAVDIESLDIESIEVVKGAAAASLYGSRAANGVIQIQTKRGRNIADGSTRITIRNEYGISNMENRVEVNQSHAFQMSGDANNPWVSGTDGNPTSDVTDRIQDGGAAVAFLDKAYPGQTYDNFDRFFNPGSFYTNYVAVAQRMGSTNYMASFNNSRQEGVLDNLDGYQRRNVRLNIDSRPLSNLTLSASAYYAMSELDQIATGPGSPFFGLAFTAPDINLDQRDETTGRFLIQPNPASIEANPLYEVAYNERTDRRNRILGSFETRFTPIDQLELAANFSYDRSNREFERFWPSFWEQIDQNFYEGGGLFRQTVSDEAINASINATFTQDFGALRNRTQLRALTEQSSYRQFNAEGRNFGVEGVRTLQNTDEDRQSINSSQTDVIAHGYYLITNFDYDGKYIVDALVRRDGSSLFGADERWHTYYRASAAYRIAEEDWFDVPAVDELKINASYGTAGGRPRFAAQYETWNVAGSAVTKGVLGNRELKPEFAREIEVGVELGLFDRMLLNVTYADTKVEDQLLLLPLVSYFGFSSQWQNAGTVESNTLEASLRFFAIQQRDMSLSFNLLYDKSTSTITEFNRPAQRYGPGSQGSDVFYRRAGEDIGTFYGIRWITDFNDLPEHLRDYANYFRKNDDGYIVPTATGNFDEVDGEIVFVNNTEHDYTGGQWGETAYASDGTPLGNWGRPVRFRDEDGSDFVKIGNALPDFSMSFSTNFRYKGLTIYALLDSQIGGEIYNQTRQWAYRDNMHFDQDQRGKADGDKKPIAYYADLYAANQSSAHFVEDGSYLKLREMAVRYQLDYRQLQPVFGDAVNRITFSLIGRNLLTWTNYSGFDPEVGAGDATILRFDAFNYPNFRTLTGSIEIQF